MLRDRKNPKGPARTRKIPPGVSATSLSALLPSTANAADPWVAIPREPVDDFRPEWRFRAKPSTTPGQSGDSRCSPAGTPPAYLQVCKCSHTLHRGRGPRIIGGSCQNLILVIAISYKLLLLASCYYLLSLVIVYHC